MSKVRWVVALALLCAGCSEKGAQTGREQEIQKMIATIERQIEEHKAKGRTDLSELDRLKGELEEELTRERKKN
ncbi:MAG: hypothetical protein ACREXR_10915 [Gammaproteobacteria bacterium]